MLLPADYTERVYAGVLGKLIGVYLGRPFENWSYERITAELGEVDYYVHDRLGRPLIVPDDDLTGTFTFLRALPDYGGRPDLTPAQIGQTWLNYIVEDKTILWWGGLGNSTEHTAYLRLKRGLPAPLSGSRQTNGQVVSEQIGAQIFIDGWAMVAPGDPEFAADLARRAASVSHDGEAVYAAQLLAAMEALAFVEPRLDALLDCGLALIPRNSVIYRLVTDLREWRAGEPDWRRARERLEAHYGYDRYGGNCHVVPNHGLIQLGLLYGGDDFQKTLLITNTSGWDTDCNSGNVGCLLGLKNGLAGLAGGPDWRGPVADRLFLPTADGGAAITDAAREALHVVNLGRALAGAPPLAPKAGARFHFELPGAVQGFLPDSAQVSVENVRGGSLNGERSLAMRFAGLAPGEVARAATLTFIPSLDPAQAAAWGYGLKACPTLYAGQVVHARLSAGPENAAALEAGLYLQAYDAEDQPALVEGPWVTLEPGIAAPLAWTVPDTAGRPIVKIGVAVRSAGAPDGRLLLDYLTWEGVPALTLTRPAGSGVAWRQAWVDALDKFASYAEPFRLIQNDGVGLLIQGARAWADYIVTADVTPHMADAAGLAACVQGLERYYALRLAPDAKLQLIKRLDGQRVLAERPCAWRFGETYQLALSVSGPRLTAWCQDQVVFDLEDADQPLLAGAIALVVEAGRTSTQQVTVRPLNGPAPAA
ncbi:MAG: ADP-ribosylglycohydrolase family protein [Anaerolineales bacterium]|nr:ADP-ribosylglycohydrolase family protein [Anaerolineales bacterium]